VQFLDYAVSPLSAEASLCQIPAGAAEDQNRDEYHQARYDCGDAMRQKRWSSLFWGDRLRRFEDGRHKTNCYEMRLRFQAVVALYERQIFNGRMRRSWDRRRCSDWRLSFRVKLRMALLYQSLFC